MRDQPVEWESENSFPTFILLNSKSENTLLIDNQHKQTSKYSLKKRKFVHHMRSASNILEIPIDETKSVNDLVKWFEKVKVYEKKHPKVMIPEQEKMPVFVMISVFFIVGMALIVLEEKGKLNAKKTAPDKTPVDFLNHLKKIKSEEKISQLIETRYDLDIVLKSKYSAPTKKEYNLDHVFGIWKNKKISLDKLREEQWGRK